MIYQSQISVNSAQNRSHCYCIIQSFNMVSVNFFFQLKASETECITWKKYNLNMCLCWSNGEQLFCWISLQTYSEIKKKGSSLFGIKNHTVTIVTL